MAQAVIRQRPNTLERWQKALQRAIDNGLEIFVVADSDERFVTSASKLDTLHRTDGRACTCEAALAGDPVCQHRAVFWAVQGRLSLEPETVEVVTAPPAHGATCTYCFGVGKRWAAGETWDGDCRLIRCPECGGTGIRPVTQPQGAPTVRPVAKTARVAA